MCYANFEQNRSLERIHIEFNQFEMALKKRMTSILQSVEEEVCSLCTNKSEVDHLAGIFQGQISEQDPSPTAGKARDCPGKCRHGNCESQLAAADV